MSRSSIGIFIFTILLIFIIFFTACNNLFNRENFLATVEKVPYIRSIGFTKADNIKLGEDCFTSPLSTDKTVLITLPSGADDFSKLTISFTMNTPKATLNAWDGTQWVPWTSGKTLVSFSNLEDTIHLKAQYFFSYTNTTYEREYIFQLSKPIWLRLKEWKPDFYNDNGQNVVLYLRLIDQEGNDLDDDRAKNGTWQSGNGIDIGYDPDELAILNYPPTYDVLRSVFPLNVKPFTNGKLTITFPDGLFKDEHGSSASGYEVSFNFDASWIDKENTVTFDSNGGSPASMDIKAVYGGTVTLPTAQTFSRGNSLLEGWYYDKDIYLKEFDESSHVTGDITVYAKWVSDTAPGVPTNVKAIPGSNHVLLFWVPPLDWGLINDEFATSITYSIQVYENGTNVATIGSITDTMAKITSLKAGTDYTFDISASNGGSILSLATRSWTKTNGASGKPENLQISTLESTSADKAQVELTWKEPVDPGSDGDSSATISSYTVYYSEKVLTGAELAGASKEKITNPQSTQTTIDGLSSRTPYYFKVTATNSAGLESEAADIPVTTALSDNDAVAIAKANLSIPLPDLSQVMSSFTLPVSGANSTRITWTIVSGTGLSLSGTNSRDATVTPPNSGSEDVQLQATISRGNGSDTKTFDLTIIPESTKTATRAVDNALAALDYSYMQFASGEDKDNVKSDVTLLTTGIEGTTLAWDIASGNAVSIKYDGTPGTPSTAKVSRLDNNDTVVFKVTVSKVTVSKDTVSKTSTLSITVLKKDNIDKHITFTVKDISISIGESGTHSLGLITALLPGDYSFSIAPQSSAMSINDSGIIAIGPTIASADTGTYTVKAVGAGPNYTGEITADFELTVNKKSLSATPGFSIRVENKSVTALSGGTHTAGITKGSLTPGTDYTLSIDKEGSPVTAVSIDNVGNITIDPGIKVSDAGVYTIRVTGQNDYDEQVERPFTLTVNPISLTSNLLGLISNPQTDFTVTFGLTSDITPTLNFSNSLTIGSDFTLAITGRPTNAAEEHVLLNSNTGVLTITNNVVADDAGTYTLTATGKGNYSGTATASLDIAVNKINISGTLSYADLEITAGQTKRSNASWNNAAPGQTVRYILTSPSAGISIDEKTGIVTVDASSLTSSTTITITAEGIGNFTGNISAKLNVSLRSWIDDSLTLTYTDIRVLKGSSVSSSPQWSSSGPTVTYDIAPLNSGTLPTEISIDSAGLITVSSSAALQADTVYQVTATGTGSWKGWKKAEIRISVYDTFYYEFKPALVKQKDFFLSPTNASSFGQFAVSPSLPDGLDLDPQTGEITGTPTKRQLAKEYTITATPTSGGNDISNKVYLFIRETASNKTALMEMIEKEVFTNQNLTADLGLIDTSNITDMMDLFHGFIGFNGDISSWDVSSVTNMQYMFQGADAFNGDISSWDVSSVTNMQYMFQGAEAFNGDISGWDVSSVTSMNSMFKGATNFNGDLSGWDVSKATNMNNMFNGARAFNGDLSGWDVSNVTAIQAMFMSAESFNGDLSSWKFSSGVTTLSSMFQGATAFNGDISGWDVSSVITMQNMFYEAKAFNGDLSAWDVSSVATMQNMFYGAKAFNGDLELWGSRLGANVDMSAMFDNSGLKNTPSWYP